MEDEKFDRQAFVVQRPGPPREPPALLRLLAPLTLLGIVGVGGYLFYQYATSGTSAFVSGQGEAGQILQRLDELEDRLARLEKRRKIEPATSKAEPAPAGKVVTPASARRPGEVVLSVGPRREGAGGAANAPANPASHAALGVGSDPGETANREAWEATSERLVDVVGELGTQRGELAQQRQNLDQVIARFQRTRLPFRLQKSSGKQRVGPIWLVLRDTGPKSQVYTMRMFVDDRWTELKDRALHEPVEFYMAASATPLELVVSEIHRGEVAGYLAIPKDAPRRSTP